MQDIIFPSHFAVMLCGESTLMLSSSNSVEPHRITTVNVRLLADPRPNFISLCAGSEHLSWNCLFRQSLGITHYFPEQIAHSCGELRPSNELTMAGITGVASVTLC